MAKVGKPVLKDKVVGGFCDCAAQPQDPIYPFKY